MGLGTGRMLLLAFCMGVGVVAGLGSYTFWYARGASYLSDDPQACVNCHAMRPHFTAWQASSHSNVATCNSCHVPKNFVGKYYTKAENGFYHSYAFTFQNYPETIRMRESMRPVVLDNCVYCHQSLMGQIVGHQADPQDRVDCLSCHAGVGHGPAQ